MTIADTKKAPVAPTTGTAAAAAPTAATNSTAHQNEGTNSIMTQTASVHEDVLRNLKHYNLDVRHCITAQPDDWTQRGDLFRFLLFSITVDPSMNMIIGRVFCDTAHVKMRMLTMMGALRDGTYFAEFDDNGLDEFKIREHEDGSFTYRVVVANTTPAVECTRAGCKDRGQTFPEGNHSCEMDVPELMAEQNVAIFFDLEVNRWLIDLNIVANEFIEADQVHMIAGALNEAAEICNRHNGRILRRPAEHAAAPEHEGVL